MISLMQLKHLILTNIRVFSHAEITFQPGMNLIIGANGVGKSTILDTLRILLSQVLPQISQSRSKAINFKTTDITINQPALTAELTLEVADTEFHYLVHQPREPFTANPKITGQVRDQTSAAIERHELTPNEKKILGPLKKHPQHPLAVYFSSSHTLVNIDTKFTTTDKNAAFVNALDHRELRLMEFADWWFVQKTLASENVPNAQRHLDVLAIALSSIMETCTNIRTHRETSEYLDKNGQATTQTHTTLLMDKAGVTLDLRQLSTGEQTILALVLDLARRLLQANPHLDDPLKSSAVVLIDELDFHFHPQWQRKIVSKLTTIFPNCQFIATTHSPQIIGEVPHENIILLEAEHIPFLPNQSLGMDTDWILKYLMGATTRSHQTEAELKRIANLIETEDYDTATDAIDALRDQIGEFPELVRLQTRIDRFQLLGE
jgi:predicted ATP-dependent endonuclease of OLD family